MGVFMQKRGRSATRIGQLAGLAGVLATTGVLCNTAAADIQTDFGVDYRATGFYINSNAFNSDTPGATDNDDGFAQYLRVEADFKHKETGIEVITRVELSGDRWTGDERNYTPTAQRAFNTTNTGDNVRLDLGFVQIPIGKTLVRIGRQEANFNNCFLVCDDRRDRIFAAHAFGPANVFALYDRRQDDVAFSNADNGDQIVAGFVSPIKSINWNVGALWLYYGDSYDGNLSAYPFLAGENSGQATGLGSQGGGPRSPGSFPGGLPYVLDGGQAVSAYATGAVGPLNIQVGTNVFYDSSVKNDLSTPNTNGDFLTGTGWAEYLRVGAKFDRLALRAQYIGTQDGGFLSTGFDSYTSVVNSNPESTANPTSLYSLGRALGLKDYNQNFYVANGTFNVTKKLSIGGSIGALNISQPDSAGGQDDTSLVYDTEVSYQYNSVFRTWVTAGWLASNKALVPQGNSLIGSLGGNSLADDSAFASSLNVSVKF